MVQSKCQYVEAYRFGKALKISGYNNLTFFGNYGYLGLSHFAFKIWLKIRCYRTRAQEQTSGAIRILLSFFVKIWELFKDGRVWGLFYQMNLMVHFDIFTIFDISPLWMNQFERNWWPNWRFFDALNESGKIFDRYDPQNFWRTLEAGAKK